MKDEMSVEDWLRRLTCDSWVSNVGGHKSHADGCELYVGTKRLVLDWDWGLDDGQVDLGDGQVVKDEVQVLSW